MVCFLKSLLTYYTPRSQSPKIFRQIDALHQFSNKVKLEARSPRTALSGNWPLCSAPTFISGIFFFWHDTCMQLLDWVPVQDADLTILWITTWPTASQHQWKLNGLVWGKIDRKQQITCGFPGREKSNQKSSRTWAISPLKSPQARWLNLT